MNKYISNSREAIGIELNEEYVEMSKKRLSNEFKAFDSSDPRIKRVPNDLNNEVIRNEYLKNHTTWFLNNHEDVIDEFWVEVNKKYSHKIKKSKELKNNSSQKKMF